MGLAIAHSGNGYIGWGAVIFAGAIKGSTPRSQEQRHEPGAACP